MNGQADHRRRSARRARMRLMQGGSAVAFLTALSALPASAQTMASLRGAANIANAAIAAANPAPASPTGATNYPGMSAASVRALQYQARAAEGVDLATQAQQAARASALALANSVPDGLGVGGLDPVDHPTSAANDPNGLSTWDGASAPTETKGADGSVVVTINQDQERAVLSWDTFNVGRNTTLVFNQQQNGVSQQSWVVLNRVVGQLDPVTGLRNPMLAPAPSQIFGSIKADGTVLILNQNGILFGGTAQINVHSLVATSLEIGRAFDVASGKPLTIADRNTEFLDFGLLAYADQAPTDQQPTAYTFSAQQTSQTTLDPLLEGTVSVAAGADIESADSGFILLAAPKVVNAGHLVSTDGEVALSSGRDITLTRSEGTPGSIDPNVRGFLVTPDGRADSPGDYVENTGLIEADRGYISLGSTLFGAVIQDGVLSSTTSVSRNGFIRLTGADIQVGADSTMTITPDTSAETIPQDPTSLGDFKPSQVQIGTDQSRVEIGKNAMIYAPSADITIGAAPGAATDQSVPPSASRVFVDTGAVIDAAGLTDVLIPASRNTILIRPVKKNELANDPNYRTSFLNGVEVYVDPRLSGVTADGVAWIGSPLIEATSYYQQVGVTASELMTRGGSVTLGTSAVVAGGQPPSVIINPGATIDVSGGWVRYAAGMVQTTRLIDANGSVVDIADANPNDTYIGVYGGFTDVHSRWGLSETWANPILSGAHYEGSYTEGRDAGALTIKSPAASLGGTVYANAYPGTLQLQDAKIGTGVTTVFGDLRHVQGAPSELPVGGMLFLQALGQTSGGVVTGGADVQIVDQTQYDQVSGRRNYGQSVYVDADGNLVVPPPVDKPLPFDRLDTIFLSDQSLSNMGLGQLSIHTSGQVTEGFGSNVTLTPGGVFDVLAGRTITIDGAVTAASGDIRLQTVNAGFGSVFKPTDAVVGSYDILVNGSLSTRGLWVNDYGLTGDQIQGDAYTSGGSITITSAARVAEYTQNATVADTLSGAAPKVNVDLSGSILIHKGAVIDVSGGGRVNPDGTLDLSATGGNLSLLNDTTYFQLATDPNFAGGISGFRVGDITDLGGNTIVAVNPGKINAKVVMDGTILAHGFNGGGTFTLDTPQFSLGGDGPGTSLALDFFSKSGFGAYNITSYKTALLDNKFKNGLGGFNAALQFQTLTIGAGETLDLTQSTFTQLLDNSQILTLRGLGTGGDLYSVLQPTVAADAWDRRSVDLTFGGALELHVAQGGSIIGEANSSLTVSKLYNEGLIRIPGGTVRQVDVLPAIYDSTALGVTSLSDVFSEKAGGGIAEGRKSVFDPTLTNGEVAAQQVIYLLGDLGAGEGIRLSSTSVTDLSGEALIDPRAQIVGNGLVTSVRDGRMIDGGALIAMPGQVTSKPLFGTPFGISPYNTLNVAATTVGGTLNARAGATIDISGASDSFDLPIIGGYAPTPVWSNGGELMLGSGGAITGADIHAEGGAPQALGGALVMLDPKLSQHDVTSTLNAVSADLIEKSGFATFEAMGSINSIGDVDLKLDRAFFLVSRPVLDIGALGVQATRDALAPTISSTGVLEIDAPYIHFDSSVQSISTPLVGEAHHNTAIFRADTIDVSGAVLFDRSISDVQLISSGDLRLTGIEPYQLVYNTGDLTVPNSLKGMLAVNGDLNITAAQVYPTTGSTFSITSSAANGHITFASSGGAAATPYTAGGDLTIQAANIVQGGVVRVPLGTLTIGSDTALTATATDGSIVTFAPATRSLQLTSGSVTSVSADGLSIPYGVTTDQIEWYFSPNNPNRLTAPPAAVLHLAGTDVALNSGAKVDLTGGGDVYAYEFISGTGGTRDVLSQFNNDPFSSLNGYQYPDGRQVYAIVPGLSNATVAAYDPIYSSNYSSLYTANDAGKQVYLSGSPGVPAGWYTLLPAQYAMLPGGMRVVEDVGAPATALGVNGQLKDGTELVTGYYGVAGTGTRDSMVRTFEVQSQSVIESYSDIAITSGNAAFAALAAKNGQAAPRLPIDAGRLILDPTKALTIDASFETTPATGGRGAEADIAGGSFDIVASASQAGIDNKAIVLTADSLTNLNVSSLLIGGVRTDNADGTTSLDVTAHSIVVANDADHPLSGPETVLAVDGSGSGISIADGSVITATAGAVDPRAGDYVITGSATGDTGVGAIVRVANGPERLVERLTPQTVTDAPLVSIGDATITGNSVLLSSSGDMTAADTAHIKAHNLALGAAKVSFTNNPTGLTGLIITPALRALFATADHLTIQTPQAIDFKEGSYTFNNLTLDAPGIGLLSGASVTINATDLTLANSSTDLGACGGATTAACGAGQLVLNATEIAFGSGTVRSYGFGGNVTFTAKNGVFAQGQGGFDAGPAAFDIQAPFIGDRAMTLAVGQEALIPNLSLTTTGQLTISNPGGAAAGTIDGTPGGSLSLSGDSVSISGTTIRATSGELNITSQTSLVVADGAVLETPGYAKSFGDAADPYTVSAPGGLLHLTALDGDIDLQQGSVLSIGGGQGNAGTLAFTAAKGTVNFGGTIDTSSPGGGGSFSLDIGGAFDLNNFDTTLAQDFTGSISIHTRTGDLALAQGNTLKAQNVYLTADGGLVDLGGTIDVSGVVGGDVALFGINGVTLESTSRIDAHATGYADNDTRQSHGGVVQIGTDGTGAITVDNGSVIDVSVSRPGDRMVPMVHNGVTYYSYVPGDVGGVVAFRAPIIGATDAGTVNVSFAGSINGASSIVLEGFKRFDLGQIAGDPNFVGVTINSDGQAVLDVGAAAGAGQLNWLADNGTGTLVDFVQTFNISASNGNLGSLVKSGVFHERPGMELDYSGDVVLTSNWNLGAGVVDVAGAVAAGLMAPLPLQPGQTTPQYYVLPGKEAQVFAQFTTLTYRTDNGAVDGEPGILTIRSGGNLDIKGSITDGFFQFHDQNDPNYLNVQLGAGNAVFLPTLSASCFGGSSCLIQDWVPGDVPPPTYVVISFPGATSLAGALFDPAPYNAAANTPSAPGSLPGGAGDPLASSQLFPLLVSDSGPTRHVDSWSYQLVGGADLLGAAGAPSVNPMSTLAGATGSVTVEGTQDYSFKAAGAGTSSFENVLDLRAGAQSVSADQWLQAMLAANPTLDANSYTLINFQNAPAAVKALLTSNATSFFSAYPGQYQLIGPDGAPTGVSTTLTLAALFMTQSVEPDAQQIVANYTPPRRTVDTNPITGFASTLVRTGTGSINLAAAGDIDLRNGATPTYRDANGNLATADNGLQVGGAAVYTAGYLADMTTRVVTDALTGVKFTLSSSPYDQTSDIFAAAPAYRYGADLSPDGVPGSGYADVYLANPVYLQGGGDVTLAAGGDILSRRDVWREAQLARTQSATFTQFPWIGTADQPWRSGNIGTVTNVRINPQLFQEGVGTLGGGDITVRAGGDIVDLSIVSDTSITTADVGRGGKITQALWTVGGGDVSVSAAGDLLGGRLDVASGAADVNIDGSISSAGTIVTGFGGGTSTDNALLIRLSDATVALQSQSTVDIQGVRALGVIGPSATQYFTATMDGLGFYSAYSGLSIEADGRVTIANSNGVVPVGLGGDLLTPTGPATRNTPSAVYPASFEATSLTGNLDVNVYAGNADGAADVIMAPSPVGELQLFSGANIAPLTIAMEDGDPGLLPGVFSAFLTDSSINGLLVSGRGWAFPGVLPSTSDTQRRALHNPTPTHEGDPVPNRIYAYGDIENMIISTPKQTRIGAGQDIINMMFFGQNLSPDDITRIVAGRDITATTHLVRPVLGIPNIVGAELPAVDGNTFVLGGPGSFFLEAGRDAGPFLNSAVTNGVQTANGAQSLLGPESYGGGILSVGNDWNPWLPEKGADLYVMFGVGKGINFDGLREAYIDPANLPNAADYLFVESKDPITGQFTPDRSQPIYGPVLVNWMQSHAAAQLKAAYGTTDVTYQQAYDVFVTLPQLRQEVFLLDDVYFNELVQTSIPTSPSYQQYSRGYTAVNTLFPASYGYTANDLTGGGNGANAPVHTGDLDLRLATIQTQFGGDIYILGPGGQVLAGSTVRTSDQAARRSYNGGALFAGDLADVPLPAAITSIPVGLEGIITLRGGSIDSFTDENFLLNQSRLFTESGGDIAMWSSNGDLNAGQGPKTSANFPPVAVKVNEDAFSELNTSSAVSGAGIAAFEPAPGVAAPDVFLIAPRGTVDAGDAGVRVAGNLFIAAAQVANANNFAVSGTSVGLTGGTPVDVGAQTNAGNSTAAAAQAAEAATSSNNHEQEESVISANVVGYAGSDDEDPCKRKDGKRPASCPPAS